VINHFFNPLNLQDAFIATQKPPTTLKLPMLTHRDRIKLQYLADKYAPATPEVTETLARLQLPPHTSVDDTSAVPLPRRGSPSPRSQHQVALVIRDGRRVASRLTSLGEASKTTGSTRDTYSRTSNDDESSMSTALEQDFTVEGKRGNLQCPFSAPRLGKGEPSDGPDDAHEPQQDETSHPSGDPICAAMNEGSTCQTHATTAAGGSKCPIRFMDQHSPEEIARYVETHKHELPRSHEVCLRRYQHNENEVRKLDSKYGNMVSMIEGLGQLHQPMLPEEEQDRPRRQSEVDRASNERVHNWAKAVTATTDPKEDQEAAVEVQEGAEREGHFDRPFKEIRVGESPSRPWGISVPIYEPADHEGQLPFSPPPAPVRMPSPAQSAQTPVNTGGKCPFDHTKLQGLMGVTSPPKPETKSPVTPQPVQETSFAPLKDESHPQPSHLGQPAFLSPEMTKGPSAGGPQMVFTGPVFIGYPVDQALQILNQYRPNNS
jgi:hypothetical protein